MNESKATTTITDGTGHELEATDGGAPVPALPCSEPIAAPLPAGQRIRRKSDGKQGTVSCVLADRPVAVVRFAGELSPEEVALEELELVEGFSVVGARYPRLEAAESLTKIGEDLEALVERLVEATDELEALPMLKGTADVAELRDLVVSLGDLIAVANVAARKARGER